MMQVLVGIILGLGSAFAVPVHAEDMASPGHPGWLAAQGSGCLVWDGHPVARETGTWSGPCVGGKASGQGELVWRYDGKKDRYVGEMRNGKFNGRGTIVWSSGTRYEGEWVDAARHGRGVEVWAGGRYEGEYLNGKQHGQAVIEWDQEGRGGVKKIEGNFGPGNLANVVLLTPSLPWKITRANGDFYEGEIKGGQIRLFEGDVGGSATPNGRGKMTKPNGDWYDGEWSGGYADGEGKAQIGGKKFTGTWARGCLRSAEQRAAWNVPRHECP